MNGPSLRDCAAALDDEAFHELVVSAVSAAMACGADGVAPVDLIDDLRFALTSGRLDNRAARSCRLALKALGEPV